MTQIISVLLSLHGQQSSGPTKGNKIMKTFYADPVSGCMLIDSSDLHDYPCFRSDDVDAVISDLHELEYPTSYIVSDEVFAAVHETFTIRD